MAKEVSKTTLAGSLALGQTTTDRRCGLAFTVPPPGATTNYVARVSKLQLIRCGAQGSVILITNVCDNL